jgi:hypothetical protein
MRTTATIGLVAAAMLLGVAAPAPAQPPDWDRSVWPAPPKQKQKQKATQKRAPTRIIVRPIWRYRYDATEFPRSDNLGYPGPNAVRQCASWLATEHRLSGTVVTPQMRCWWERG